jgi:hypothetical protein
MALPNLTLRSVKGGNLTAEEFDNNHLRHEQRIDEAEANPTVVSPTNVTEAGGVLTFHFSNNDSFPVPVPNPAPAAPLRAAVTGDTFTPALADSNRYIRCTNAGGCVVTIPPNAAVAFPLATELNFRQAGDGGLVFVEGDGVTINPLGDFPTETDIKGATVTLKKVATNEWDFISLTPSGEGTS